MVLAVASFLASGVGSAFAQTFDQVDFSSQANFSWAGSGWGGYFSDPPIGPVTLGGIPFNIASNGAGNQAWAAAIAAGGTTGSNDPGGMVSITMNVNIPDATNVYTLINTWMGQPGPNYYAWLTFMGSDGATYTEDLVGNVDIRDYNNYVFTDSINGTTTTDVFNSGNQRLDMQNIALPSAFATQTLTTIELVDNGGPNFQRTVLDGVTVASPVPEPSALGLLAAGAIGLVAYGLRRRAAKRTAKPTAFDQQDDAPAILSMPSRWSEAARRAA
jgi:hypothetical protein